MARCSVIIGVLLCGLSVYGMVGSASEKIATAFIPMLFGIPLVICGVVALNPHRRRIWMGIAAIIGILGSTGAAARATFQVGDIVQGEWTNLLALRLVVWMSLLCATFVVIYVIGAVQRARRQSRSYPTLKAVRPDVTAERARSAAPLPQAPRQTTATRSPVPAATREPAALSAAPQPMRSGDADPASTVARSVDKRGQLHRI